MEKAWYLSKTIWAGIILIVLGVARGIYQKDISQLAVLVAQGLGIIGLRDFLGNNL